MKRWLLTALWLAGCPASTAPPPATGPAMADCRLEGLSAAARCGEIEVPEDRDKPDSRRLALRVAVVPATLQPAAPDPLFILVGGPGQAASEAGAMVAQVLTEVRRRRAIVLVDQRGTGASAPLDCKLHDDDDLAGPLDDPVPLDKVRACVAGWSADTRRYRTVDAADDLEDVRKALGYDRINLWGASYGTRLALEYLRRHGDHARSVILDGVAPAGMVLPLAAARDGQAALDRVLEDARGDHPDLKERLDRLLAQPPAEVVVDHPRTGARSRVTIDRDDIAVLVRGALYSPELASVLPVAIDRALAGDFGPFAAISTALSGGLDDTLSFGLMLAVVCSEDVPRIQPGDIERAVEGTVFGPDLVKPLVDACAAVTTEPAPAAFDEPVRSDVPALILSGGSDPATPPRWGERAAEGLTKATHVTVPEAGHGLTVRGCLPERLAEFLEAGASDGLDFACAAKIRRAPFFSTVTGPTP